MPHIGEDLNSSIRWLHNSSRDVFLVVISRPFFLFCIASEFFIRNGANATAATPTTTRLRTTAKLFDCIHIIKIEQASERKNAERDDITDIEPEPETEEEQSKAKGIRELFLQKIRKQKEEYEQRTSTAVTEEEIRREEAKDDVGEYERKGQHKRYDAKLEKEQRNEYHLTEDSKARQKRGAINSNKVQAIKRAMQRNSNKK